MLRRKLFSLALVLTLALLMLSVNVFAAEDAPELVDGYYEIYTADHLYWFAEQVNGGSTSINGKLMADIVVNENVLNADGTLNGDGSNFRVWTPIGNDSVKYMGTFEGNGKTVSGLYFNASSKTGIGLFGYLGSGSTVRKVGVVVSYFSGNSSVGGVVGNNSGTVSNCYNAGSVSGGYYAGGVVGNNSGTVSNCYSTGYVSGSKEVGGVVGYNSGNIKTCYNIGSVSGSSYVGGVMGENDSEHTYAVYGCYNTGSVIGSGNYVGGVVGFNKSRGVSDSYNTGGVSGSEYVGGVAGNNYVSSSKIQNCYNTGSVSGSSCVGGVAGDNNGTVSNCYNKGSVSGSSYVGGVVGDNNGPISGCYNTGSVSGSGEYTGGVVGENSGTVTNCYYLSGRATRGVSDGTAMTAAQFASGEVSFLLQGDQTEDIWGQLVGAQLYPAINGEKVYKNGTVYANLCEHDWAYSFDGSTYNLSCSVCGQVALAKESTDGKEFKFNTAAPALSVDIVMNIAVTVPEGFASPYMVIEFNGKTATITEYTINADNGRYEFAFPGINPQTMGDTFHATLYAAVDGVQVSVELDYSMMKYINSQLKKSTISDALRTALSDLVMYGEANQVYEGYKTDALLSTLLESTATLTPSTFPGLDDSYNAQTTSGTKDANIDLKGVSMILGSKVMVRMTTYCADPSAYSVKVNIGELEYTYAVADLALAEGYTDRYVVAFDQIKATQFGDVITFSFLDADGNQVGRTLTYSVYTYVQKNQANSDANLVALLEALYNYGESVKNI